MRRIRKTGKSGARNQLYETETEQELRERFEAEDINLLRRKLRFLEQGKSWSLFYGPEWTTILRLPPAEAKLAATDIFMNINLVAALIFSSVFGNTLEPIRDENRPRLAASFNISLQITSVLSLTLMCFTCMMLIWTSTTSPAAIHRALLRMDLAIFWQICPCLCCYSCIVTMINAAWLFLDWEVAQLISCIVVFIYVNMHTHFFTVLRNVGPIMHNWWAGYFMPCSVSGRTEEQARCEGSAMAQAIGSQFEALGFDYAKEIAGEREAAIGQLGEDDSGDPDVTSSPDDVQGRARSRSMDAETIEFLDEFLPGQPARLTAIRAALHAEGVTLAVLLDAATEAGSQFVFQLLDDQRFGLSRGELAMLVVGALNRLKASQEQGERPHTPATTRMRAQAQEPPVPVGL